MGFESVLVWLQEGNTLPEEERVGGRINVLLNATLEVLCLVFSGKSSLLGSIAMGTCDAHRPEMAVGGILLFIGG
jgi:hypothetical protein